MRESANDNTSWFVIFKLAYKWWKHHMNYYLWWQEIWIYHLLIKQLMGLRSHIIYLEFSNMLHLFFSVPMKYKWIFFLTLNFITLLFKIYLLIFYIVIIFFSMFNFEENVKFFFDLHALAFFHFSVRQMKYS